MIAYENHWLTRDSLYREEMSEAQPDDFLPKWDKLQWERGDLLDFDAEEREGYYIMTTTWNGVTYEGTGTYSCGELILVDGIEIKK